LNYAQLNEVLDEHVDVLDEIWADADLDGDAALMAPG